MPSLKETKIRINSVKSTLKTTSAMKMVASAKLHRAQQAIGNMVPYESKLHDILSRLVASAGGKVGAGQENQSKRVAIVAFSSNSSLCGSFNANVVKKFHSVYESLLGEGLQPSDIDLYIVGRKIGEAMRKSLIAAKEDWSRLADRQDYASAAELAQAVIDSFDAGEVGRVLLVYNHFASSSSYPSQCETYLPLEMGDIEAAAEGAEAFGEEYIIEPDVQTVIGELLPKVLRLKIYTVLLDATQAEHAARTVAMQTATDNGDKLLEELTLEYNKRRQMAITNELLDIVGGSIA